MTDNEIIKALECCVNIEEDCKNNCPMYEFCEENSLTMVKAIRDLINRQKAGLNKYANELKEITEKFNCQQTVYADLSDIIREKNAEIEKLNTVNAEMHESLRLACETNKDLQAEVERFKKIETTINDMWNEIPKLAFVKNKKKPTLEELLEYIENLKDEAIKEFAERLKENSWDADTRVGYVQVVDVGDIEDLVKEMVGDTE